MKIACLQPPLSREAKTNVCFADRVIRTVNPKDLDLLLLPELAFSRCSIKSLIDAKPFLEGVESGITSLWAKKTAKENHCIVIAGFPEKYDPNTNWPAAPEFYNSTIVVNTEGKTIRNHRNSLLYYTGEYLFWEGAEQNGYFDEEIPRLGRVVMGLSTQLSKDDPDGFARHVLDRKANLVILSLTRRTEEAAIYSQSPKEPDMEVISGSLGLLKLIIEAKTEGEIICVITNRIGIDSEDTYSGTSAVLGIQAGRINVYGILGRGEMNLLVVDTNIPSTLELKPEANNPAKYTLESKQEADNRANSMDCEISCDDSDCEISSDNSDETVTALSPVDANGLQSFSGLKDYQAPGETYEDRQGRPNLPRIARPLSPKVRNTSLGRTRDRVREGRAQSAPPGSGHIKTLGNHTTFS